MFKNLFSTPPDAADDQPRPPERARSTPAARPSIRQPPRCHARGRCPGPGRRQRHGHGARPYRIASRNLEIALNSATDSGLQQLIAALGKLGAPKRSSLHIPRRPDIPFRQRDGMAIFLNGTDLPETVFATADVNDTISGLNAALIGKGFFMGHWQGPLETALSLHGGHSAQMQPAAAIFAASDPLCAGCRFEQIA